LVESKRVVENDPHLLAMEVLDRGDYPPGQKTFLHFALGKAYADVNDHARAFAHLLQGNALKRAQVVYTKRRTEVLFERIKTLFIPGLVKKKARHGERSHLPVRRRHAALRHHAGRANPGEPFARLRRRR